MGCDIHMLTEIKVDGKWKAAPAWEIVCWSCDGKGKYAADFHNEEMRGQACNWCDGKGVEEVTGYNSRSYNLFAALAGVRQEGRAITPIAEPRGVPRDASPAYKKMAEEYGEDGHSHSWYTLAQLDAYDWGRGAVLSGYIPTYEDTGPFSAGTSYDAFVASGRKQPNGWCRSIGGPGIVMMSEDDYKRKRMAGALPEGARVHVRVSWKQSVAESMPQDWFDETLPALRALAAKHGGPDNVRIVFFFDN